MRTSDEKAVVWISIVFVVLMIVAFTPSYFKPVVDGTFQGASILHLHGALFFAWPVLFSAQTLLATGGRLNAHRSLGLLGVVLATSMLFTGVAAVASDLRLNQDGLALVALAGLAMFVLFVTLALVYRRRRDYHFRWMFLATLAIMQAVSARLVIRVILNAPPPVGVPQVALVQRAGMLHLAFDVIVLAIVGIIDWRKSGRVHPVYVVGGAMLMTMHAFRHLFLDTAAWRHISQAILALIP